MKVQVLYFKGCPNHRPTVELAQEVVADLGLDVEVEEVEVKDAADAQRLRFFGSPSVHVNGVDIDPEACARTDYAFGCRKYGSAGVPPRKLIEAALNARFPLLDP